MNISSTEDSLKRKSLEGELEKANEALDEPQTKMQKIEMDILEPNLKNDNVGATQQSNLEEVSRDNINEKRVEEQNVDTDQPSQSRPSSISIKFQSEAVVDKYKSKVLKFLESFIEFDVEAPDDHSLEIYIDDSLKNDEWVIVDASEVETTSKVVETVETHENSTVVVTDDDSPEALSSKKKRKKHSKVKKELFIVDATPSPSAAKADLRYTTKFTISSEKEQNNVEPSGKQGCFNCGQLHSLKDCTLPRDYNRINLARQKLFRQQSKSRYHLEEEQKFSHLSPGKLSNELKNALGLHKNEAPHFIYTMRRIGYPPGWLEEAKLVHSDLEMFDIDGNFVKTASVKKQGLDPVKIVDFPGFNVPFEKGIKDEYRKYGVPPYSDDFSKETMLNVFQKRFAQQEDNLETCDMDIDHEQETSSSQEKLPEIRTEVEDNECRDSPSLLDLEQQKRQLLEELKDEKPLESQKPQLLEELKGKEKNIEMESTPIVKTTHFGTPILKSNSPYMTLPDPDKFSKDVSPVINFENLPNSTGKYEQMTDVLQKVRSTLKKMQEKCNT